MAAQGDRASERRAILWGGAVLAGVALVGHLLAPGADLLWLVLLFFAVAAVPQAFTRRR
jgi:hypothetical protein